MQVLKKMQQAALEYVPIGLKMATIRRPNPEFMWWMSEVTKFTPDAARLEEFAWQLLYVPDELKRDHIHHGRLGEEAKFKFPGFTVDKFHFWDPKNPIDGYVPMILPKGYVNPVTGFPPVASIKGEIYVIRPQRFFDLDRHKQNTIEYERHRIRFVVPYRQVVLLKDHNLDPAFGVQGLFARSNYVGSSITTTEEKTCIIRAWMYIGRREYWDPLLSGYDFGHVETFNSNNRRWLPEYYSLRRPPLPPK